MEVGHYLLIMALVATTGLAVEEQILLNFYNSLGMQPLFPATSCREIYKFNYASHDKSGDYWIKPSADAVAIKVCTNYIRKSLIVSYTYYRCIVTWSCHVVEEAEDG